LFCSAAKIFVPVHFREGNGELFSFGSGCGPLNISVTMTVNMRIIVVPQNNSLTQLGLVEQERIFIHLLVQNINKYDTNNKNKTINNDKIIIKINNTVHALY
jgi:hypothetical protein